MVRTTGGRWDRRVRRDGFVNCRQLVYAGDFGTGFTDTACHHRLLELARPSLHWGAS